MRLFLFSLGLSFVMMMMEGGAVPLQPQLLPSEHPQLPRQQSHGSGSGGGAAITSKSLSFLPSSLLDSNINQRREDDNNYENYDQGIAINSSDVRSSNESENSSRLTKTDDEDEADRLLVLLLEQAESNTNDHTDDQGTEEVKDEAEEVRANVARGGWMLYVNEEQGISEKIYVPAVLGLPCDEEEQEEEEGATQQKAEVTV